MIDGAEQNFTFRRADVGFETLGYVASLEVEFDANG